MVGASLEEGEDEEDNASVTSSVLDTPKEGCYEVVGTLKDREKPKPEFVKELILVSSRLGNMLVIDKAAVIYLPFCRVAVRLCVFLK